MNKVTLESGDYIDFIVFSPHFIQFLNKLVANLPTPSKNSRKPILQL